MSEPRWIRFERCAIPPGRKTSIWNAVAKDSNVILGSVFWYGAWRCYAFGPTTDMDTVYEHRCLRDIADFVEARTKEHRAARAAVEEK